MNVKHYLKNYFSRNKKLILISLALFLLFCIIGYSIIPLTNPDYVSKLNAMPNVTQNNFSSANSTSIHTSMTWYEYFFHNGAVCIISILGGFLFSIPSVIVEAFNAISISFPLFTTSKVGLLNFYLIGLIPHGIFEYSGTIFSLVCAFLITKLEIRLLKSLFSKDKHFSDELKNSKLLIKDIITSLLITLILTLIAGIIESNITPLILAHFF